MTLQEFEPAFRAFTVSFNKDITVERTQAYFDALRYYEAKEVADVLKESITQDEYFPTVGQLVARIKSKRKPKIIACEYCNGSGWELVYARTDRTGPFVTKEQFDSDPTTYHMFAMRCRCRPPESPQEPKFDDTKRSTHKSLGKLGNGALKLLERPK